jgi:hypothetical protein
MNWLVYGISLSIKTTIGKSPKEKWKANLKRAAKFISKDKLGKLLLPAAIVVIIVCGVIKRFAE